MLIKTESVVIRTRDYGESHKLVWMYTVTGQDYLLNHHDQLVTILIRILMGQVNSFENALLKEIHAQATF